MAHKRLSAIMANMANVWGIARAAAGVTPPLWGAAGFSSVGGSFKENIRDGNSIYVEAGAAKSGPYTTKAGRQIHKEDEHGNMSASLGSVMSRHSDLLMQIFSINTKSRGQIRLTFKGNLSAIRTVFVRYHLSLDITFQCLIINKDKKEMTKITQLASKP